jgi:hypothetical protein
MSETLRRTLAPLGAAALNVTALVVAGVARRFGVQDVRDRIEALSLRDQTLVTGGVLGLLFLLSLFAAQFGVVGMLVFFLGVILIAR